MHIDGLFYRFLRLRRLLDIVQIVQMGAGLLLLVKILGKITFSSIVVPIIVMELSTGSSAKSVEKTFYSSRN